MARTDAPQTQGIRRSALPALSCVVVVLTLTASALTLTAHAAEADVWQPPATIAAAAEAAVASAGPVAAVSVDERLKLKRCAAALEAELAHPLRGGRGVVAVSCPKSWRLFVPVRASSTVPVVQLKRSVQPGDVLAIEDLGVAIQAAATLPHDYVNEITQAVGLAVRRTQPAGAVLTLSALAYPPAIERGALVTLLAEHNGISVKTEGVALEPARLKQRVRVRSASGRVIEGTADGPGLVRVGF